MSWKLYATTQAVQDKPLRNSVVGSSYGIQRRQDYELR